MELLQFLMQTLTAMRDGSFLWDRWERGTGGIGGGGGGCGLRKKWLQSGGGGEQPKKNEGKEGGVGRAK